MHVAAWYNGTDPLTKSSRNLGNKFWLARPPTLPNFVQLRGKVRDIYYGKILLPRKSRPKFTLGVQICHQSIGRTLHDFWRFVVTLALDYLVSEISLVSGFVSQMPPLHIPPSSFTQYLEVFPRVRSMSILVQTAVAVKDTRTDWAMSLGCDVIFG